MNILEQIESIDQTFRKRLEQKLKETQGFTKAELLLKILGGYVPSPSDLGGHTPDLSKVDAQLILFAFKTIATAMHTIPGYRCKFKKNDSEYEITWDKQAIISSRFEYLKPIVEKFKGSE